MNEDLDRAIRLGFQRKYRVVKCYALDEDGNRRITDATRAIEAGLQVALRASGRVVERWSTERLWPDVERSARLVFLHGEQSLPGGPHGPRVETFCAVGGARMVTYKGRVRWTAENIAKDVMEEAAKEGRVVNDVTVRFRNGEDWRVVDVTSVGIYGPRGTMVDAMEVGDAV